MGVFLTFKPLSFIKYFSTLRNKHLSSHLHCALFTNVVLKLEQEPGVVVHWVKSGVAYAGSHTGAAAESIQKIAVPAVASCGSPL